MAQRKPARAIASGANGTGCTGAFAETRFGGLYLITEQFFDPVEFALIQNIRLAFVTYFKFLAALRSRCFRAICSPRAPSASMSSQARMLAAGNPNESKIPQLPCKHLKSVRLCLFPGQWRYLSF